MGALDALGERGFSARLELGRLAISPAHNLIDSDRRYIRRLREALLADLRAAVKALPSEPLTRAWNVMLLDGQRVRMVSQTACTTAEALDAARWRWPGCRVEQHRAGKDTLRHPRMEAHFDDHKAIESR